MPKDEICLAAESGDLEALQGTMKISSNRPTGQNCKDALMGAAEKNQPEACTMLLDWGVPVASQDSTTRKPLHVAAAKGYTEVVNIFLKRGAEFLSNDHEGNTPLGAAVTNKHLAVCKCLLLAGAKLTATQSCKGLAAIVAEVQLEVLVAELKVVAANVEFDPEELLEVEEEVWAAQQKHMRLLRVREEQKAGLLVTDLERHLETESACYGKLERSEDALSKELTDLRVNLQSVETSVGLMKQQLDTAEDQARKAMEEEAEADVEYQAMMNEMKKLKNEQDAADRSIYDKGSAKDNALVHLKMLQEEVNSMKLGNRAALEQLRAESAELRGWERDKEAAAALTAQANELLNFSAGLPLSPKSQRRGLMESEAQAETRTESKEAAKAESKVAM